MSIRKIARELRVDRNTVRAVIQLQGDVPKTIRSDKIEFSPELIGRLYRECDGYAQRIHEKLTEEYDVVVGYSTLTGIIRDLALGNRFQVSDYRSIRLEHRRFASTFAAGILLLLLDFPLRGPIVGGASFC